MVESERAEPLKSPYINLLHEIDQDSEPKTAQLAISTRNLGPEIREHRKADSSFLQKETHILVPVRKNRTNRLQQIQEMAHDLPLRVILFDFAGTI